MVLAENGPSVQVQPSSNAQLLGDQNVDSALSPEITETVLVAADDGCISAPAFRCMVYDGTLHPSQNPQAHLHSHPQSFED